MCCGGEKGEFSAIRLEEENASSDLDLTLGLDPGQNLGEESIASLLNRARRFNKNLVAKAYKLAKDRVNCITLWFPPTTGRAHAAYTSPVAVLANNDCTVTLVDLGGLEASETPEPLDVITYPDFVNRAIISPDGRLLIAILDDPYLYVHERIRRESSQSWQLKQRYLLKSQIKGDRSDSRGSFAACFSESGNFLAVGTQHGTISVFDATMLTEDNVNPLISTFKSSRPESSPGAVRDMAFCPGPFDILAWTEDRGRVGVADMRSNFIIRQIVDINVDDDYEHVNILDRNTIDPRLLSRRPDNGGQDSRSPLNRHDSWLAGGRRRAAAETLETLNQPLTANEMMVLEAIQADRRRTDRAYDRAHAGGPGEESPLRSQGEGEPFRPIRERSSSMTRALGDLSRRGAAERVWSARQLLRDAHNRDTQMRGARPAEQQRPTERADRTNEGAATIRPRAGEPEGSYISVLDILQQRERDVNGRDTLRNTLENDNDAALLVPLVNQVVNRWEESALRGTLTQDPGVFDIPPSPDNTAGLSFSEDGRIL